VAKTQNYGRETRARAVRLVREHARDYPSEFAAIKAVAARLGIGSAEALRKWVRQAEVEADEAAGVSTAKARQVRDLQAQGGGAGADPGDLGGGGPPRTDSYLFVTDSVSPPAG